MKPSFAIEKLDPTIKSHIQREIDSKTKPIGALGRLEEVALRIGLIQQSTTPVLRKPTILVFAGDHGLSDEGVSQYPKEVTAQMVHNFLNEGAAINVFTRQHGIELLIVDAGVDHEFATYSDHFLNHKIRRGTRNSLVECALTEAELHASLQNGKEIVQRLANEGSNIIGFGEMGIGNTSSASLIMSQVLGLPISDCVGRGTGLNDEGLTNKLRTLERVKELHRDAMDVTSILMAYAGYEIAQMIGSMLEAAARKMVILVDGFIASTAFLAATKLYPAAKDYAIFCHESAERGHQLLLAHLDAKPIVSLDMRLGEGTGCAVAFPIIQSAVNFLNEMASFESAGVSKER